MTTLRNPEFRSASTKKNDQPKGRIKNMQTDSCAQCNTNEAMKQTDLCEDCLIRTFKALIPISDRILSLYANDSRSTIQSERQGAA